MSDIETLALQIAALQKAIADTEAQTRAMLAKRRRVLRALERSEKWDSANPEAFEAEYRRRMGL